MTRKVLASWCPARDIVFLQTGQWSTEFPGADLPQQLAFYRRLRDRRDGRYAHHFTPTIAALEDAARERAAP